MMMHKRRAPFPTVPPFSFRTGPPKILPVINTDDVHIPRSPHRRLQNDSAIALGVGRAFTRIPLLIEKPIVRSPRPSDFNKCLLADIAAAAGAHSRGQRCGNRPRPIVCDEQVESLSKRRTYTSTTRESTEEAALPTLRIEPPPSTLERDADPVRCRRRAARYAPRPAAWQHYAREWDAMQLRKFSDSLTLLPQIGNQRSNFTKDNIIESQQLETEGKGYQFLRPMPGYGGFIPRHAVEQHDHPETERVSDWMCSTARSTYRSFPAHEYKVLEHAHKGPFSKTVTMTHPLNPFNKVEHQARIY